MCPLDARAWAWVLVALSAVGMAWQARRYRRGSRAARAVLLGWAVWLGGLAWALATAALPHNARLVAGLSSAWLGLSLATAWVVVRDWRAATQARRAAEAAIDRRMQAEMQRLLPPSHPGEEP